MCELTKASRRKSFTGFKVVVEKNDNYYSPATGLKYVVGEVPRLRKKREHSLPAYENMLNPYDKTYIKGMVGKTGVFSRKSDAVDYRDYIYFAIPLNVNVSIIKITISGELWRGTYDFDLFSVDIPVIVGTHIDKIELLKQ